MENRNFVNLSVNPCKMCMPMGAVTAFKGIENSIVILHGSQGCSTYIRRHMAGHYNEPIDIASTSLTEEGTVYGGENNLKKGLKNVIKLYNPSVIGVGTTCLAETIGEDIKRITSEFSLEQCDSKVKIIPVSTPGYGGTQFEGYFAAICSIAEKLAVDSSPNDSVNIITSYISPADTRNIKEMLELFKIKYTLLPDISQTLDAPYSKEFKKIPEGGTKLEDISKMAGARATIEIGLTVPESISPGTLLKEKFNIPLYKCPMPIGLKNTDEFLRILSKISGSPVPDKLKEERGRFIDGMIDSHKHNGEGRAVIFGEPEMVYAISILCMENGIKPVLISTGAKNIRLGDALETQLQDNKPVILDNTDFETIEKLTVKIKANIPIGNSDGKFITEKQGIPLVRLGFPIHDRVGGQRLISTGYNGSLRLLDDITNTLLAEKYEDYRKRTYNKYFKPLDNGSLALSKEEKTINLRLAQKTATHPCFSSGASECARMHVPVAPSCNISCNYCNRKYDCVNESRPGVTSEVLSPQEAQKKFIEVKEKVSNLKVVGIAGPGDALADFKRTKKTIELIKEVDPDITFCLSTNGLMLSHYADEIIRLGVSHVTVTINAIDPKIGSKIYSEVNCNGRKLTGEVAAEILIINQLEGLKYLSSRGIVCKVNIVMIKGVNDQHIESVVKKVKECGAFMTNIMPLIRAAGSNFENIPETSNVELNTMRRKCELDLKQMYHCKQCRADAIGKLGQDCSCDFRKKQVEVKDADKQGEKQEIPVNKEVFAVASRSGMYIDLHFGQVEEFHIYELVDGEVRFVEKRKIDKYCTGEAECDSEESKIDRIIKSLEGCSTVLAIRIGYRPMKTLGEKGISIVQYCGNIEDGIRYAAGQIENAQKLSV